MITSCLSCQWSKEAIQSRGQARRLVWWCSKTQHAIDASHEPGRSISCDMFEMPDVPFGFQPEMPAELL